MIVLADFARIFGASCTLKLSHDHSLLFVHFPIEDLGGWFWGRGGGAIVPRHNLNESENNT